MARPSQKIKNPMLGLAPPPSSPIFHLVSCAAASPFTSVLLNKRSPRTNNHHQKFSQPLAVVFLALMVSLTLLGVFVIGSIPASHDSLLCSLTSPLSVPAFSSRMLSASFASTKFKNMEHEDCADVALAGSQMLPLPVQGIIGNVSDEEREFWEQPDGEGYKPCLDFSVEYRKASVRISKEKRRFLVVVASGGLNQQRNQIVDAVVIARILGAALVVPVLQVNLIWGDESEFSEIFDVEHFKRTLRADMRIVSSLPSTHWMSRQSIENQIPHDVSPFWIRSRFSRQLNEEGVLVLNGLDSKLSRNLPPDLQKLRCKVAFHALRFAEPIQELGNRLARRMWIEGPYISLHLRIEKDVWVRSGCRTGLGPEYDGAINKFREAQPEYLTGRLNMTYTQRRRAGFCPLTAFEISRLLKAIGAPSKVRIHIAGGEPFGGDRALQPLVSEFKNLVNKWTLAREGELSPYINKASALAAIDYVVALSSNVFIPSHGGNMGRLMKGHRAYIGHRKYITPNKRAMLHLFDDPTISDSQFRKNIRFLHRKSQGQPEPRNNKRDHDVIVYPVPECMSKRRTAYF